MYIYWLFIYSTVAKKQMTLEKNIHLLPCNYFTLYKNKALPTMVCARPLHIDESEDDLNLVLSQIPLVAPHVMAVSELTLSHRQKTFVLLLEVPWAAKTKLSPQHYHCHATMSFYTKFNSPAAYINANWCPELGIFVPQNTHLRRKIKINLGHNIMITTRVQMKTIIEFIFINLPF